VGYYTLVCIYSQFQLGFFFFCWNKFFLFRFICN
jgi:hypothetical protein